MKTNTASKGDFLDDVVDEMGDGKGGSEYGADMDADEEEADDETVKEDGIMAAKALRKALGIPSGDDAKIYDALKALVSTCM